MGESKEGRGTEFNAGSEVAFTASIWLHPRPLRACAGPQAGVSPPRRSLLVSNYSSIFCKCVVNKKIRGGFP